MSQQKQVQERLSTTIDIALLGEHAKNAFGILCQYFRIFFTPIAVDPEINPYPTAFPYGNGMVLHFYQQQESSTTKTVHKVINKGLKTYV